LQHSLVSALNLTQVSFTDWAQVGENALAWVVSAEGKSMYDDPEIGGYNWTNNYKFGFGQTRLGDQEIRKTNDKIDFETILTYKLGTYVNPYVSATLKTQFARGFQYSDTGKTPVSKFFDPGYMTQSAGVGYQPIPEVKTRLGAGLREVFAKEFAALYSDDPATTDIEKVSVDGGLESVTEVEWKLEDNILFTSKLELFGPFKKLDEIVVRNDNTLAMAVSKYIAVNLNVQLINEKRISPRTQVKETLSIGLTYRLL
jgi:hypothetical protein